MAYRLRGRGVGQIRYRLYCTVWVSQEVWALLVLPLAALACRVSALQPHLCTLLLSFVIVWWAHH